MCVRRSLGSGLARSRRPPRLPRPRRPRSRARRRSAAAPGPDIGMVLACLGLLLAAACVGGRRAKADGARRFSARALFSRQ